MDEKSLSHTSWNCKYHIVLVPKYRRKVIYGKLRKDIGKILRMLCNYRHVEIIEAHAMPDHIHMLLSIPPKLAVADFMGYLKGKSTLMIFERHANMKYKYGRRVFWTKGYYVNTVDGNEAKIRKYIRDQEADDQMCDQLSFKEYADYNLVVAGPLGMPTEQSTINGALKRLIEKNNLPKVVFHSFRHSSITYKLKLNGGDIKAVQGDSGHAQASMVTEQYAHILDDDRCLNAQRFDDFFYQHHGAEPEMPHQTAQSIPENSAVDADAAAALTKLLANPSMAELIKNLAKNL